MTRDHAPNPGATDMNVVTPAVLDALSRANIGYIVMFHRNGAFEKWDANDAAMRKLGYTREQWLALPTFGLMLPDQRGALIQLYERLCAGAPITPSVELVFVAKSGQQMPVEVSYGHAETPEGNALVLIWSDEVFRPRMSMLEADRVSLVGALAAGFAHETNNPLTSVLLNLRSLKKLVLASLADAKQAAALRVLDDLATASERIANNVRAFQTLASRGTSGPVDLVAVTSAVLRLAAPTLEPRAHVVRQILPVPPIVADESRLGQAVLAMLLFAVSGFSRPGDPSNRIVVAVCERDGHVFVEVTDNGSALAPDELAQVFDPMFRPAARGSGVGGGLAIALSVASSLGGEVTASLPAAGGVAITMRLPPPPR